MYLFTYLKRVPNLHSGLLVLMRYLIRRVPDRDDRTYSVSFETVRNVYGKVVAARCYARGANAVMSVRPSVAFVHSVKTNKHIFNFFSPSGSHAILVFLYRTSWLYFDGDLHDEGASNGGEVSRNRDSEPISTCIACCQRCDRPDVINTVPPDHRPVSCDKSLVVSGGVC